MAIGTVRRQLQGSSSTAPNHTLTSLRSNASDGCQLRRSRSVLTRYARPAHIMALDPTGGTNTTPYAQDDYGKRLEHVSIALLHGKTKAHKNRSKRYGPSSASASSTKDA